MWKDLISTIKCVKAYVFGLEVRTAETKGFFVHVNKYCDFFLKKFTRRADILRNTLLTHVLNKDLLYISIG